MNQFFSRPIGIDSFTWDVNTLFSEEFNPFQLYFNNPKVMNRIANYRIVRADMCLKFVITGTQFHYGRIQCAWMALRDFANMSMFPGNNSDGISTCSMRPHVWLDVTTQQGGCLELPFVYPYDALDGADFVTNSAQMGSIVMLSPANLKHALGDVDPVSIFVFGWLKNVQLAAPTTVQPVLTPQAGPTKDEYGEGIISKPATSIAKMAGVLENAPVIGKYATASRMAASGIASIARLFGFSKPTSIAPVSRYKPQPTGNLANTDDVETCPKLTFDSKSEVTVDPRVVGLSSKDEMLMSAIFAKETYLTAIPWDGSHTLGRTLFECRVNPMLFRTSAGPGPDTPYYMTSMAFGAAPFEFWCGSITYRFSVIASMFHKGRIRITWEPFYSVDKDPAVTYNEVVDIAETRDFDITVAWGSNKPYLRVQPMSGNQASSRPERPYKQDGTLFDQTDSLAFQEFDNGRLRIDVLNPLIGPETTVNDVNIAVFVRSDDLEVFSPSRDNVEEMSYFPDLAAPVMAPQAGVMEDIPPSSEGGGTTLGVASEEILNKKSLVFHGDPIVSLRQILKRYDVLEYLPYQTNPTVAAWNRWTRPFLPIQKGYITGAMYQTGIGGKRVTYTRMTMFSYFRVAFLAYRGSMRYKVVSLGSDAHRAKYMHINRRGRTDISNGIVTLNYQRSTATPSQQAYSLQNFCNSSGTSLTTAEVNPVVEAELPYHHQQRFIPAQDCRIESNEHNFECGAIVSPYEDGSYLVSFMLNAMGDDGSLTYYVGPPPIYIIGADPLPL